MHILHSMDIMFPHELHIAPPYENSLLQCCGSWMFIPDPGYDFFPSRIRTVSIPDPGSELSPSRIPDPGSASKNLSILNPKKTKKLFLSSRKYDPGCSSRIPDPDADFLPIPDPGSMRQKKGTGSQIRIRNTATAPTKKS
jgi:hypothetical protein